MNQLGSLPSGHDLSQATLLAFLNQLPHSTTVCTFNGTIIFVNEAWTRFAHDNGYAGGSFVGQNYFDVCDGSAGAEHACALKVLRGLKAVANCEQESFEHIYSCHGPSERRWLKLFAVGIGSKDFVGPHQLLIIQHLNARNEIEHATSRAIADRDAKVAHDLQSGIAAIQINIGHARVALGTGKRPDQLASIFERAEDAAKRMYTLTDGMLFRAKLYSQTQGFEEKPLNLEQIIVGYIKLIEAQSRSVRVNVQSSVDSEVKLLASFVAVDRIMSNLISNAVKYSRTNGTVVVTVGQNRSGGLFVSVADKGIGIPTDVLPKIFDQYERDERVTTSILGEGIGLAVVKELVDELDATISVSSKVDIGTIFTVEFPRWRTWAK